MTNSADPDQLASSEVNWSGSTLFAKTGHVVFSKRRIKINCIRLSPWFYDSGDWINFEYFLPDGIAGWKGFPTSDHKLRSSKPTGSGFQLWLVDILWQKAIYFSFHHENMPIKFWPPQTPLLYSKTGVYRGMHYFSYFCSKHKFWVLVRTASTRRF